MEKLCAMPLFAPTVDYKLEREKVFAELYDKTSLYLSSHRSHREAHADRNIQLELHR